MFYASSLKITKQNTSLSLLKFYYVFCDHISERKFIFPFVSRNTENNGVMRMTVSNHENEDETEETTAEFEMREMGDFSLSSPSSNEKKESIYDYGVK